MDKQLPIMNDPIVKEYMSMLFDNNQHKEYDNTKDLVEYIESMEKQFEILTQELRDIKEQLNSMQNPTMKLLWLAVLSKNFETFAGRHVEELSAFWARYIGEFAF